MKPFTRFIIPGVAILVLMAADQLSKWWVGERFFSEDGAAFLPWLTTFGQDRATYLSHEIASFLNLVIVWNKGVSFGMFRDHPWVGAYVITALAVIVSVIFAVWMAKSREKIIAFSATLIIAGALSNVWDRLRFGAVFDFIDFHLGEWHYPAFNLADSCIVIGVIVLVVKSLFLDRSKGDS